MLQVFLVGCSGGATSEQLVGKWEFVEFYAKGESTPEMEAALEDANRINRGLTIRFSPAGQFESDQPGGGRENNSISDYRVLPDGRLLVEKDTLTILKVDGSFLQLHKDENSFDVMFRRLNSTGTEPGRQ